MKRTTPAMPLARVRRREFLKRSLATGAVAALGGGLAMPAIGQST